MLQAIKTASSKFLCRHELDSQHHVYKSSESKGFRNFEAADQCIATTYPKMAFASARGRKSARGLLEKRGLRDRSSARIGDCCSDVALNTRSEECACGETVKVYTSDRHFKKGRLVYSSTHELFSDRHWDTEERRRRTLCDINDLSKLEAKREPVCCKLLRMKMHKVLRDIERQSASHCYNREKEKTGRFSRSLPPPRDSNIAGEDQENCERALRSKSRRKQKSPFTIPCYRKTSPVGDKCLQKLVTKSPRASSITRVSSEVSITSKESWTYSSTGKEIRKTSRRDEIYRTVVSSPPRPNIRKDLFVVPEHTCGRKPETISRHESRESVYWDAVSSFSDSPTSKDHGLPDSSSLRNSIQYRVPVVSEGGRGVCDFFTEQSTYDSDVNGGGDYKRPAGVSEGRSAISPKSILHRNGKKYSPRHKVKFAKEEDINGVLRKPKHSRQKQYHRHHRQEHTGEGEAGRHAIDKYKNESSRHKSEHKSREVSTARHVISSATTDSESETRSGSRTRPFSPMSDSSKQGYERSMHKGRKIWSTRDRSNENSRQKAVKQSETSDAKQGRFVGEKLPKKRRNINPNKIVHFGDSGKRLSQYFTSGEVTLDSDKAFEDHEKVHSKKLTLHRRSPGRSRGAASLGSREMLPRATAFREESLEDYIRRITGDKRTTPQKVVRKIVNEKTLMEYREKNANGAGDGRKDSTTERTYDYRRLVDEEYRRVHPSEESCDACRIDEFWAAEEQN